MEKFVFDVVSQTLTITAKFANMMGNPESEEYKLVMRFCDDFPNLTIAKKTHKSATSYTTKSGEKFKCNQFKNLTYDRMEKFITALPKSEDYLREYKFVKEFASNIQTNGYTLVRRWFVAQFPDFRKNPLVYLTTQPAVVSAAEVAEQYEDEAA